MSNWSYEQDIFSETDQDKNLQTGMNQSLITFFNKSNYYNDYRSNLSTNVKEGKHLLDILAVFKHVSIGAKISDEYFDELNNYICMSVYGVTIENIDKLMKMFEIKKSFNGQVFTRVTIKYLWEDYPVIAKCCIDWLSSNPEKISIN